MHAHITAVRVHYIIECPTGVLCLPGLTPLLIELTCVVSGVAVWRANGRIYIRNTLTDLTNGIHKDIVIYCYIRA